MNLQAQRIQEIENEVKRFQKRLNELESKSRNLGSIKAGILLTGIIAFFISFFYLSTLAVIIITAFYLICLGILTMFHNEIDNGLKRHRIWIGIKRTNLARIKIDWQNLPLRRNERANTHHPFEFDLNISGEHSVHRLIDSSLTKEGSLKLLKWLTIPSPSYDDILRRQRIIKELIPLTKFRQKLILNSNLVTRKELHGNQMLKWLTGESNLIKLKRGILQYSIIISVNTLFILLGIFGIINSIWPVSLLILLFIYYVNSKYVKDIFDRSQELKDDIGNFYVILKFLEEYKYGNKINLKSFCSPFIIKEQAPSTYFKKIDRLVFIFSIQKNPLIRILLNVLFPWDFFQAYKFERIKSELVRLLPGWLDKWYELEALISIANFAYLNPNYSFPEIKSASSETGIIFETRNIAHPLIPFQNNITNDFKIMRKGEVIIITGSNMSGKSTFLKTVGLNLALAFAGGVVNAEELKTDLFRIFTSINITDSVVDGISYFYAEVKRLKELLNEINKDDVPVFFLIDEIFKGTNNYERLIGSRSYIKSIAGKNCTGIISTHDLELIRLEKETPFAANYHFKEEITGDKMIFKYKITAGPSPTTNALKIMRLEGLPID